MKVRRRSFRLARDEITIGRLEGNTIRLTERNVSRRHARLLRQNGALYIEDLASFTGVRVNGTKIAAATPLREGDEVQIGDYRIALRGERDHRRDHGPFSVGDRPTMPSLPAVAAPMGTVGGSVAIPTRASVAAMAAQPAAVASLPGAVPAVPPPRRDRRRPRAPRRRRRARRAGIDARADPRPHAPGVPAGSDSGVRRAAVAQKSRGAASVAARRSRWRRPHRRSRWPRRAARQPAGAGHVAPVAA